MRRFLECIEHKDAQYVYTDSIKPATALHITLLSPYCRYAGVIPKNAGFFGRGLGRVHLDNLNCTGRESRLQDCPHSAFEQVTCRSFEDDVGIICPRTYECYTFCLPTCIYMYMYVHVHVVHYTALMCMYLY